MKIYKYRIFTAGFCLALASVALAQPTYTATRMPTAYANGFDNLTWISDDGKLAVGETDSYADDHSRTQPCVQYKDGTFTVLPTPNFNCTVARGNTSGAFVGTLFSVNPAQGVFDAFIYRDGTFTLLAKRAPGQSIHSYARGLNARGDVSGWIEQPTGNSQTVTRPDGSTTTVPIWETFGFVYTGDQIRRLESLFTPSNGTGFSEAEGINNLGDVTGMSLAESGFRAALWPNGGGVVDLGVLPGDSGSRGVAVNSKGQVAGVSTPPSDGANPSSVYHAFFYDNGQMTQIPIGDAYTQVMAMNDEGEVLLSTADPSQAPTRDPLSQKPFYYKDGQSFDLNTLVTNLPDGVKLILPIWINNSGQILVVGSQSGHIANYLLTPGPESPSESGNRKTRRPSHR